jgi:ElaB/YqjD/DUF883 family membrane-anchored ribosome-binding protein
MQEINQSDDLTSSQNSHHNGSTFDNIKSTIADKMESAADALRQNSGQARAGAGYVNQASDWLGYAADYVRDIEPAQIKSDLQRQVRSNPGRTLLIAGAVGLGLGILLRRR